MIEMREIEMRELIEAELDGVAGVVTAIRVSIAIALSQSGFPKSP
jgi:hypothetical protein